MGVGVLAAWGLEIIIAIVISFILLVVGLFIGHIILFDSIALGIVAVVCCNHFLPIHPALCFVIGIAVFLLLFWLQITRVGFWIIGGLLSLVYAVVFGLLAFAIANGDPVWGVVVLVLAFFIMGGLHLYARDKV